MSLIETVKKVAQGHRVEFRREDYIFEKILYIYGNQKYYDTQNRLKPLHTIYDEDWEDEWTHSRIARMTLLENNDEKAIAEHFDLFKTRMDIDYDKCGSLLRFHSQGVSNYGEKVYYIDCFDGCLRDFDYWVHVDHNGAEIETLDVYRLIVNALKAFDYLQENGYTLTRFDDHNYYCGSFSEDRPNFFRLMFYGVKGDAKVSLANKNRFSPPENEPKDLYKSYAFSVGLMALYAIFLTNGKGSEFPADLHSKTQHIGGLLQTAINILYKEGSKKPEHKELFKVFMEDLLQVDETKRVSPKDLLSYKWLNECHRLDYEEY